MCILFIFGFGVFLTFFRCLEPAVPTHSEHYQPDCHHEQAEGPIYLLFVLCTGEKSGAQGPHLFHLSYITGALSGVPFCLARVVHRVIGSSRWVVPSRQFLLGWTCQYDCSILLFG